MATYYGTSLACVSDLVAPTRLVSGRRAVAEAVARRLITPTGGLIDDRDYGFDLRAYVNADVNPSTIDMISFRAAAEAEKDERVQAATATAVYDASGNLSVTLTLSLASGPFTFTLRVSQVTAAILGGV